MKKIALFISSLQKGGSERVMVNLAEYLHKQKYEVLLVTQYKKEVEYDISPEIKRVYSEPTKDKLQGNRIQNFRARFDALRQIWIDYKPDLVLVFIGKNNFMTLMTSYKLPHKVAVSVRADPKMEYPGRFNKMLVNILFPRADLVILQTQMAKDFFNSKINKKVVVLPNPLNPVFLNTTPVSEKKNLIVAAGRLDENKNHAMLINAFAMIEKEFPEMKLVIYGEGELRPELEKMVQDKGLQDKISLPGSITDVADKVKEARIFTLTSNTEGMPNSIMEAMAVGTPVISTDCPCGGPKELITNGENGLLVPVGDAISLADAFRKILNDAELEKRLQTNSQNIKIELHPDNVNKKWEEAFWSLFT